MIFVYRLYNRKINWYHIYKSVAEWLLHMEHDIATYNQVD